MGRITIYLEAGVTRPLAPFDIKLFNGIQIQVIFARPPNIFYSILLGIGERKKNARWLP